MAGALKQELKDAEEGLLLLQVLADNGFDSVLVTDASLASTITYGNLDTTLSGLSRREKEWFS